MKSFTLKMVQRKTGDLCTKVFGACELKEGSELTCGNKMTARRAAVSQASMTANVQCLSNALSFASGPLLFLTRSIAKSARTFLRVSVFSACLAAASTASAQEFTGSATGGDWTLRDSFGTWSMTFTSLEAGFGLDSNSVNGPNLGYVFTGPLDWDLTQTFTITPDPASSPDALFRLTLEGNAGIAGSTFGARFLAYDLDFSPAGGGPFVFLDPDDQIFLEDPGVGSWQQRNDDTVVGLPAGCETTSTAIRNNCLTWSVVSPTFGGGPATMTLTATEGRTLEGFNFTLSSIANIEVSKAVSFTQPQFDGASGFFDIVASATDDLGAFRLQPMLS